MSEKLQNLNIDSLKKQRYAINSNEDLVLEIDIHDINIVSRIKETFPKIDALTEKLSKFSSDGPNIDIEEDMEGAVISLSDYVQVVHNEMCELLDYLFDANIGEVFGSTGNMFSVINGRYRFEIVLDSLLALYDKTITAETKKLNTRISKHTGKYTKK